MDSPLLSLPGAVAADPPDAEVASHYGEPSAEQRALAQASAMVDRSNRGVVRVAGADRLRFLHSLTSQHLEALPPHEPAEALLLSPTGHVEHHLALVDDGSAVWIHVEPGTAAELARFLDSMRFMLRVEVSEESESYAVITVSGELEVTDAIDVGRGDLIIPRERLTDDLGVPHRGSVGLRGAADRGPQAAARARHRPPHDSARGGWIGTAVHLNKGCYRGQETVARVHNLGRPPRRLVFLHLDGSVDRLPKHGDPVELDGTDRSASSGSAARHYELGPIGLAMIKRNVPIDAALLAGSGGRPRSGGISRYR